MSNYEAINEQNNENIDALKFIVKFRKSIWFTYIIVLAIFFAIVGTVFAFCYFKHLNSPVIQEGIFIKNIDVSGLTKEDAKIKVASSLQEKMSENIILKYKNIDFYLPLEQIEATFDIDSAVDYAYNVSRSGTVFENTKNYIKIINGNINIDPKIVYSEEELKSFISDLETKLPDQLTQSSYYVEDDKLIITNGKVGAGINEEELSKDIQDSLQDLSYSNAIINIPTYQKNPDPINIDAIHQEIYKEPKNANYNAEPYEIQPHVIGVDFKISIEDAKNMVLEDQEEFVIPLELTTPDVTINDIGLEAFPDLISTFSTKYVNNPNRTTNLRLASNKIDGTVLMPGDVFSYNKVVGKRTIEAGYKEAAIYSDGQVTNGLGGGICQISSTLYNSVVFANLDIVERRNHMFIPSYVKGGRDATVVYGSTDFKFKNTRNYPIKIISSVENGIAKISIYGLLEENEYDIDIETKKIKSIPYTTQYKSDKSYKKGTVIQGRSKWISL